ncbi:restriction endonuclease subunit S [Corynebacterium cystitidis]|uniref:restriction endonuclease subunit S n=1 Tax=Corynebacterium cystitidis TaxID=35757 RepID=UPI00211E224C|nr:restriction endonuclease subunit S [Corynebacterium cystitidis]
MATTKGSAPWPMVKLGDICTITIGKTPARKNESYWGEGFPWLSIKDMNQGRYLSETSEKITQAAVNETNPRLCESGTVVFSFKLSIGKVGITTVPMYTNEAIAAFVPKERADLDRNFLYHALRWTGRNAGGADAVMGKTLNKKTLSGLEIPLPPLDEQRRIAEILDRSEKNVSRSQTLSRLYSDLASEMVRGFEDRAKHLVFLHELGEFRGGMTPSKAVKKYWNGGINWFTTKDLSGKMNLSESLVRISSWAIEETSLKQLSSRAIAFSLRGMSLVHRVPMGIIPEGSAINQDLKAFIPHRDDLTEVLYWQIKLKEPLLLSKVSSSAHGTRKLDFEHLQSFKIPAIQDHDLEDLLTRLRNIADLVSIDLRRLEVAQELHKSLSTRAFQGEL